MKRAKRLAAIAGITVASCFVALIPIVMIFENRFIYFPARDGNWDLPKTTQVPVEDVFFAAEDGVRLHGWFARGKDAKWTLLWFHGNAGNIGDRFNTAIDFVDRLNVNVFIIDYRGYGRSEGSPGEKGLYLDATAAYRTLLDRGIPAGRIVLLGKSLGGAVAADLAARVPCAGVVLQSTFTSAPEMSKLVMPFFPARWFMRTKYDTLSKVKTIRAPKLFLHSRGDDIVPFRMAEELYAAAAEPKRRAWFDGSDHGILYVRRREWTEAIRSFLDSL
ncbi:MAG: alpha/beta hydrolase [Planctomycetes bacterium]|nr:alpha/beta hydrolase [Planctomycetota bacterium]